MLDKKPTTKQWKEVLKWCGLQFQHLEGEGWCWFNQDKNDWFYGQPELDLNNLFKYAVPKLLKDSEQTFDLAFSKGWYWVHVGKAMHRIEKFNGDATIALFWAIWEVIHADE